MDVSRGGHNFGALNLGCHLYGTEVGWVLLFPDEGLGDGAGLRRTVLVYVLALNSFNVNGLGTDLSGVRCFLKLTDHA